MKNQGFALPSVLIISFLITSLLLGFISVLFFYHSAAEKDIKKRELELTNYSVLQNLLIKNSSKDSAGVILKNSIENEFYVNNYGLFKKIIIRSKKGNDSTKIIYLLGSEINEIFNNALIITDPNIRMSVAGDTKIIGNILCSHNRFTLDYLINIKKGDKDFCSGKIYPNKTVPQKMFNDSLIQKNVYNNRDSSDCIFLKGFAHINSDMHIEKYKEYICDSLVIEENTTVSDINIISKGNIYINQNCLLTGVQIFSLSNIYINKSTVHYPSIIMIYAEISDSLKLKNRIEINESNINGIVMHLDSFVGMSINKGTIYIDDKSVVKGMVYSENNLELKGEVIGPVVTYNFLYDIKPTEYVNWLINTKINREKLDETFIQPLNSKKDSKYKILKQECIY